ncbi:hypothetical protein OIO90_002913 [Microbotryomycetes sp. JL221]|nr:hypothetical protein OIO90_002913 [Microbotryomycetes sp. JL221]
MAGVPLHSPGLVNEASPIPPQELASREFVETRSVTLEWKVSNLKQLFESSQGSTKSKCVKNSGHEQYMSLYLSCEPTQAEKERGLAEQAAWAQTTAASLNNSGGGSKTGSGPPSLNGFTGNESLATAAQGGAGGGTGGPTSRTGGRSHVVKDGKGPWRREGKFKFTFEAKTADRRMTFKQMEANDHSFDDSARNWGYANFWKRSEAYFNNPTVRVADAFLIVCTIVYSPTPPSPPPLPRLLIPPDLVSAYASLFDDPEYSDVVFRIRPAKRPRAPERRLYAAKKVLAGRSDYFDAMFNSGFNEAVQLVEVTSADPHSFSRPPSQFEELDDEDENDFDSEDEDWDDDDDDEGEDDDEGRSVSAASEGQHSRMSVDDHRRTMARVSTDLSASQGEATSASRAQSTTARSIEEYDEAQGINDDDDTMSQGDTIPQDESWTAQPDGRSTPDRNSRTSFVDAPVAPESPVKPLLSRQSTTASNKPNNLALSSKATSEADVGATRVTGVERKRRKQRRSRTADSRPRFEVIVTDAGYQSYRALLHYLYTDSITFAPLSSNYHVAKEASAQSGVAFPFTSKREYLLANTPFSNSAPGGSTTAMGASVPCSAKEMYRLADKLGLTELKDRAFEHIVKNLTVQNIPLEVFGTFASQFEEVKRVEIAFLLDRWNEAKGTPSMRRVFEYLRTGKFPGFESVFFKLLENLEFVPKPIGGSEDEDAMRA